MAEYRLSPAAGRDLADQFQKAKPGLKVIYSSVSSPGEETQKPALPDGLKFLPKPFTPDKLVQAVQSCITRGSGSQNRIAT